MLGHDSWLKIAKEDLLAAKTVLKVELFSTVTYHCQQTAEKALKGYLVFKNKEILRTHDLQKLTELCMSIDNDFEKVYENIRLLNPYSTKFRYPTEYDIPDFEVAQMAIKNAEKVIKFVIKKIEEPETGQINIFE